MKPKIDFKDYEAVDKLDKEEAALFESLKSDHYESILSEATTDYYAHVFEKSTRRNQASTIRLTPNDCLLAKIKAKEEGLPYQVLLASVVHKWLHGKLVEAK